MADNDDLGCCCRHLASILFSWVSWVSFVILNLRWEPVSGPQRQGKEPVAKCPVLHICPIVPPPFSISAFIASISLVSFFLVLLYQSVGRWIQGPFMLMRPW